MPTKFLAQPDFLTLLRFWDDSRAGRDVPEWDGHFSQIPAVLLPNLIISERRPDPVYLYVGAECARRWGREVTGRRMYDEVLTGAHAAYIRSLEEDVIARRAPIFSAAIYGRDQGDLVLTGRLFVPFTEERSTRPCFIMAVQLFRGSDLKLSTLGDRGFAEETERQMIAAAPTLCDRLEKARHFDQAAGGILRRDLAEELAEIARDLSGDALVRLPRFSPVN
jgi:hypothetical protein